MSFLLLVSLEAIWKKKLFFGHCDSYGLNERLRWRERERDEERDQERPSFFTWIC